MAISRRQILTFGPVVLVAICYAISAPSGGITTASSIEQDADEFDRPAIGEETLEAACDKVSSDLKARLGLGWNALVHEPFVVCGDFSDTELRERCQHTIVPTARALTISYFVTEPVRPIAILICSNDDRFRECNIKLDEQERKQYSGVYVRKRRRLMVNIGSGEGTLAHELTHALAHADFPSMPEWFDEGLASLHEECEFSADGLKLIGNSNWRREVALDALNRGELRMLMDVASNRFGMFERANIDYAYVRSFCLYLQERGILESFYRSCRENAKSDPTGLRSLCRVANAADPQTIDDDFRSWLIGQDTRPRQSERGAD